MKVVLQKSFDDCGLACLAMIAGHFKRPTALETVAGLLPPREWQGGASMKRLAELARELGLRTQAIKCGAKSLHKLSLPGIAHFSHNHYVVVTRVGRRHVRFLDPRYGPALLTREEFEQLYSGLFLTFGADGADGGGPTAARRLRRPPPAPWARATRRIFVNELGRLLPFAAAYGCALLLSLSAWAYWALNPGAWAAPAVVANGALLLGLLIFRATFVEHYLLRRYAALARALAAESLGKSQSFYQEGNSYRLADRYRWLVEFAYYQRYAALAALQLASTLAFTAALSLLLGEWRASLVTVGFGLLLALEVKASFYALEQSEGRYYQRMLVQRTLDSHANGDSPPAGASAPALSGTVNFWNRRWWLPALVSYLPAALVLAAAAWAALARPGVGFARVFWLTALFVCLVSWHFVKGQLSGFAAFASGWQQLSFMSFMKQLNDSASAARREADG